MPPKLQIAVILLRPFRNFMKGSYLKLLLSEKEKATFLLHLAYAVCEGLTLGVLALNEVVLVKDFSAGSIGVGLLIQAAVLIMPFTHVILAFIKRSSHKKRFLLRVGLICRLPMLAFAIFPAHVLSLPDRNMWMALYIGLITIYYLANPFVFPVLNLFTRNVYEAKNFGKLFSYTLISAQVMTFITTFIFGYLLDKDPDIYRLLFPLLGIVGLGSVLCIVTMPYEEWKNMDETDKISLPAMFKESFRKAVYILKHNKAFAHFQYGMMTYGIGYQIVTPMLALFLANLLGLGYAEIAFYKNIPIPVSMLAYPLIGMQLARFDVRRIAAMTFLFNFLYYGCLVLAIPFRQGIHIGDYQIIYSLALAFVFNGLFAASIGLVWGVGATYFAPPDEAGEYHAIHLSLTGIRGLIGPSLGTLIFSLSGYYFTFGCCLVLQLFASALMLLSIKRTDIIHLVKGR